MKNFLKQLATTLLSLALFSFFVIAIVSNTLVSNFKKHFPGYTSTEEIKPNTILTIKLEAYIPSHNNNSFDTTLSLSKLEKILIKAAKDEYITGLYIDIGRGFYLPGYASLENFRKLIQKFKTSGKKVVVYMQYANLKNLVAISDADCIIHSPGGCCTMQSMAIPLFNYKNFLDKVGVNFNVYKSGANKSLGDSYVNARASENTKSIYYEIASRLTNYCYKSLETSRGIPLSIIKKVNRQYVNLNPSQAKLIGLIDIIGHESEALRVFNTPKKQHKTVTSNKRNLKNLLTRSEEDGLAPNRITWQDYEQQIDENSNGKADIVVLRLSGTIVGGKSTAGYIGDEDAVKAIRACAEDKSIKAVIIEMDSGGGDAIASEEIRHSIEHTTTIKPLVASIDNMAASGGLLAIIDSHYIFINPNAITGSIGAVSIVPETSRLLATLGIYVETVKTSPYSDINDMYHEPSEEEKAINQHEINYISNMFRNKVIEARQPHGLQTDKLLKIADGRPILAHEALACHLVDEIGSRDKVIKKAAELAGLKPGAYTWGYYQKPISWKVFVSRFIRQFSVSIQQLLHQNYFKQLFPPYALTLGKQHNNPLLQSSSEHFKLQQNDNFSVSNTTHSTKKLYASQDQLRDDLQAAGAYPTRIQKQQEKTTIKAKALSSRQLSKKKLIECLASFGYSHNIKIKKNLEHICITASSERAPLGNIDTIIKLAKESQTNLPSHDASNLYKKYTQDPYSKNWRKFKNSREDFILTVGNEKHILDKKGYLVKGKDGKHFFFHLREKPFMVKNQVSISKPTTWHIYHQENEDPIVAEEKTIFVCKAKENKILKKHDALHIFHTGDTVRMVKKGTKRNIFIY